MTKAGKTIGLTSRGSFLGVFSLFVFGFVLFVSFVSLFFFFFCSQQAKQESAKFFYYKRPNGTYFTLCQLYGLCYNYYGESSDRHYIN